jgi:hypothetical protein
VLSRATLGTLGKQHATAPLRETHIECNMAHDCRVVWQPDIFGIVLVVFASRCARLLLVDYEGALDIDAHVTRVQDGLLNIALDRGPSGAS